MASYDFGGSKIFRKFTRIFGDSFQISKLSAQKIGNIQFVRDGLKNWFFKFQIASIRQLNFFDIFSKVYLVFNQCHWIKNPLKKRYISIDMSKRPKFSAKIYALDWKYLRRIPTHYIGCFLVKQRKISSLLNKINLIDFKSLILKEFFFTS